MFDPENLARAGLRRIFGNGWIYRFPRYYHRLIEKRFSSTRRRAFERFLHEAADARRQTCLDIACGTGITALFLASRCPRLRVIGIDSNPGMLAQARREADKLGLGDRCTFLERDLRALGPDDIRGIPGFESGQVDMITCALGYSVVPDTQAVFRNTFRLLKDDGLYAIFDEYDPGAIHQDFAADQSHRSWELLESHCADAKTEFFGKLFIAIGRGKKAEG
jgi:ubiquinone/menaquinone biosynthesis C-methylase UbiE